MKSIKDLDHLQKSLLFAKLSQLAYNNIDVAKKQAKVLGFTTTEFYDKDGAQAYRFMSKANLVIACRGTQPTEFNDLKADLKALPVLAETVSRVHRGFKAEVDELWPMIKEDIDRKANLKKELWFCGHSLGAAMATIMSSRAKFDGALNDPIELFDIVTTVPPAFLGFKHHGTENYLNAYGLIRTPTGWQLFKDKWRGIWMGLKQGKIDSFSDHSIDEYIKHIESALAK